MQLPARLLAVATVTAKVDAIVLKVFICEMVRFIKSRLKSLQ